MTVTSPSQSSARPRTGRRPLPSFGMLVAYLVIALGAVFCLLPFYMMMVYATHSTSEIFSFPPKLWFGNDLLTNLHNLGQVVPFVRNVWNSFYIAVLATLVTLLFCSLAGFGFAMYEFRGREWLFSVLLATMLVPGFLGMVPSYLMFNFLHWLDRPIALWLPGAASAFGIFLVRQYMGSTIPRDLMEAGRLDGCSELGLYTRIALPLSRPALGTLGLITFIGAWNNFQGALIVMQSKDTATIQLALRNLRGAYNTDWGALYAGTAVATIPLVILFVLFSRQLITGLMAGSVKG